MTIDDIPVGELHGLGENAPEQRVQALHPARCPLPRIRIGAVDLLVVLHDVSAGRIIITVDALLESPGNLISPFLIDVILDLGLQPTQLTLGNLLKNLASHDLGAGHV